MEIVVKENKSKNNSEIIFFKNEEASTITKILIRDLKKTYKKNKILFIEYSITKEELLKNYKWCNHKNITIIEDAPTAIDDLEKYIDKNKIDIVYIDYYKLTSTTKHFYINGKNIKYVKDKLDKYYNNYGVKFKLAVNMNDKEN